MMSNFRDSVLGCLTVVICLWSFALEACVAAPATDTPAPALIDTLPTVSPPSEGPYHGERVQIHKVQARTVSKDDPWIKRIIHPDNIAKLDTPVLISAEVTRAFRVRNLARTASPVIVLNGQSLSNSIVVRDEDGKDRVFAVVQNSEQLRAVVSIQVGWLGALRDTISPPVEVKVDHSK